jgi:hypothetical protein
MVKEAQTTKLEIIKLGSYLARFRFNSLIPDYDLLVLGASSLVQKDY